MYPQAHGQLGLFFTIFLALAFLVSPGSGTCTDFTVSRSEYVTDGREGIFLEHIVCAPEGDFCHFTPKAYNITVPRTLNLSIADPAEEQALFGLIAGRALAYDARVLPEQTAGFALVTLSAEYTTSRADLDFFAVDPGWNSTLSWSPSRFRVAGRLSGCSNATLEGVYILAGTAFMKRDQNNGNRTTLAGSLGSRGIKPVEDPAPKGKNTTLADDENTTLDDDENAASQRLGMSVATLSICLTIGLATMTGLL